MKRILPFFFFVVWCIICVAPSTSQAAIQNSSRTLEFRGAWVPTIVNLCFPSKMGLSAQQQKAEIIRLLQAAQYAHLNNLFFQVRPEADAFYTSSIEPWSRYLSGVQGKSPHFDPLQYFIEEGHRRGIAIHAWFNPYRVAINRFNPNSPIHISRRFPFFVRHIGKMLWLDPGDPRAQNYIIGIISDVMRRYDIDGVHIDDYFYPYPEFLEGKRFPDGSTYQQYCHDGGRLALNDWRRASVSLFVERLSKMIHQQKPGILFGISPFGIYTKGQPSDVKAGLDQLHELYADPLLWMREGWVDYMAPQLYWKNAGPQSFRSLLRWWRSPEANPRRIPIYPGIALEQLTEKNWPVQEIEEQLHLEKTITPRKNGGFLLWNVKQLEKNIKGVASIVRSH